MIQTSLSWVLFFASNGWAVECPTPAQVPEMPKGLLPIICMLALAGILYFRKHMRKGMLGKTGWLLSLVAGGVGGLFLIHAAIGSIPARLATKTSALGSIKRMDRTAHRAVCRGLRTLSQKLADSVISRALAFSPGPTCGECANDEDCGGFPSVCTDGGTPEEPCCQCAELG